MVANELGRRVFSKRPVTRSSKFQPRKAIRMPAGSLSPKSAPTKVTAPPLRFHCDVPSTPIVRISLPIQELIADGVTVQNVDQPVCSFSSDRGGKKAPARTDHVHSLFDFGEYCANASSRSTAAPYCGLTLASICTSQTSSKRALPSPMNSPTFTVGLASPAPKRSFPKPPSR